MLSVLIQSGDYVAAMALIESSEFGLAGKKSSKNIIRKLNATLLL
jgi:hypothetical protein